MPESLLMRAVLAFALAAGAAAARAADTDLRTELERLAHRRVFFGHQSVGANVLEGIAELAARAAVPVRLGEAFLAENGKPLLKLESFEHALAQQSAPVEIALMKFCYVDFGADTDAAALFARYEASIERLRARYPGTVFVHVTAPLTTPPAGPKAWLKRLLGRAPYGTVENLRRGEYNALLRAAYQGREPIFDLARLESTAPDGRAVAVQWQGRAAPAMDPAYSDDGGHLNATGRLRAARELISVLAALPDRRR
jgi:hypothetical protein